MTPFAAFLECSVVYDGRACSTLESGNYLVVWKQDGSLLIHGAKMCSPKNYMGSGTKSEREAAEWRFIRKSEKITITVQAIHWEHPLYDWSDHQLQIRKTESDLRRKLRDNIEQFLGFKPIAVYEEYQTDMGPVDLLAVDEFNTQHVVELKRGKASMNAVLQLDKYLSVLPNAKGYIAAPKISPRALTRLGMCGWQYIAIDFD